MPFPRSRNPRAPWNGWNKWRGRKRTLRRTIPLRALSPKVARKRREWGWVYNDIGTFEGEAPYCLQRCIEWGQYCNDGEPIRIPVVTPAALALVFQDNVTIAAMQGRFLFRPDWPDASPCLQDGVVSLNDAARAYQHPLFLRAYLQKLNVPSANGGVPTFIDPMNATDWTDRTGVLKEWNHIWMPDQRMNLEWSTFGATAGVCSNVTRDSYLTPATSSGSQPQFTVPEIETACQLTGFGEACTIQRIHFDVRAPKWYVMNVNRRKPIDLREDDSLDFFVNWTTPRPDAISEFCETYPGCNDGGGQPAPAPCLMRFMLQLKVLYQYG